MGASGARLFDPHSPGFGGSPDQPAVLREALPDAQGTAPAVGGHGGPLTARQKYLLGFRVDVNRAGYREISGLPGISDAVARAVVAERQRRGGFRRPEELLAVPGIKEKRLKKILPFLAPFPNN